MRYIDADKMLEDFKELNGGEKYLLNCYNADWIESFIESRPDVDVQEVRHGTCEDSIFATGYYRCSVCYAIWDRPYEYCPHCGSKMDGGMENEKRNDKHTPKVV